ncbi:ATP-grasp domain-containing protein [Vreelandella alkaliphila]|uniref:ATP-grasp domain-containing protein n=1 Tax=Vreelandella alkaliphila TaxID=272774 RepID=A0A7C9NQN0_9GAMM|nr:ATP-grasp domain-containing protein [Halomonas alkaliphila]NDL70387.1 ATP-grasp domain-containing protein [Halomonas alkaliphila]
MSDFILNDARLRIEIFTFKASLDKSLPSYMVAMSIESQEGAVFLCRRGYLKNSKGKVPELSRLMIKEAAQYLVDEVEKSKVITLPLLKEKMAHKINRLSAKYKYQLLKGALKESDEELFQKKARARVSVLDKIIKDISKLSFGDAINGQVYLDGLACQNRAKVYSEVFASIEDYEVMPLPNRVRIAGRLINEYDDYNDLKLLKKNGTKGYLFYYYSLGYGLTTHRLSKGSFIASSGASKMLFSWSSSQLSSIVSHAFCVDKETTRHLLNEAQLPVPQGRSFEPRETASAIEYANLIGYPVVCKPLNGSKGEGVVVNIKSDESLSKAFNALKRSVYKDSDVIVEKFVKGKDYRIVVVGDEVKGALCRELASVEGDGVHSTVELMLAKHALRMRNPHFIERSSFIDEDNAFGNIEDHFVDLERVPEKGERVVFGTSCNLSQGADSVDVLDELHPTIKEAAVKAVKCIPGLRYCGVDMLLEDHTKPVGVAAAAIIELNAKAAIGNCEYPVFGHAREVVKAVFGTAAKDNNMPLNEFSNKSLKVKSIIRGSLKNESYLAWANKTAKELGVEVEKVSSAKGQITLLLKGELKPTAMMATRLIVGPSDSRSTSVKTIPIAGE